MKNKLLLLLAILVMPVLVSAQVKHKPYVSPSASWAPTKDLTYSLEAGTWGIESPTSYGLTFDAVRNVGKESEGEFSYWLGTKAYLTVKQINNIYFMVYLAPKIKLDGSKETLLEYGLNPCIALNDNLQLSITLGNQSTSASAWNTFMAGGLVIIFNK